MDIAFAVVVLASYFATFSALKEANPFDIVLLASLGIAYIVLGIYGFSFCLRKNTLACVVLYFCIQIPLGAAIVFLGKGAGFNAMVLVPLVGHAVVLLPPRWSYFVDSFIISAYLIVVRLYSQSWSDVWSGFPVFIAALVFVAVFTQMAVDEEKSRKEVERLLGELEDLAVTRERNRMAREIHDGLGHYLTTVHMQIQAARAIMDQNPNKAKEALDKAQSMTQEALQDIRQSVASLRVAVKNEQPLPDLIKKMVTDVETHELETEFRILGIPRPLSQPVHLTLFRAAQEGVNNVCKHSRASKLELTIDYQDLDEIKLIICDNGVGAEQLDGGFGLPGLRERIYLVNGRMNVSSEPGEGFILEVIVPG